MSGDAGWPMRRVRSGNAKLLGPRLAMRLTGKAWEVTYGLKHDLLRKSNGVKYLLNFLKERLGRTSVPDSGQKLEELFVKLRRYPQESFATWAVRVMEAYKNVQRSLARVRSDQKAESPSPKSTASSRLRRGNTQGSSHARSQTGSEPQHEPPSPARTAPERDPREQAESPPDVAGDEQPVQNVDNDEEHTWQDDEWYGDGWTEQDWYAWNARSWRRWKDDDTSDEEEFTDDLTWADLENSEVEVLPQEILGWILLRRANLPPAARLSVQAAAHKLPEVR